MQTEETPKTDETLKKVIEKINEADSILVTLSKDPTVDEMTAALGLTIMLGNYGKHATAIYSGKTPNALQFLRPDETFEANTNSLQDFIIALNKEKADHLRYKIEGDFVKVYITPYKTTISESDLEFSRGEVNVDLVVALDVIETEDLDAALAQHGRIMHSASLINISSTAPGRLGGVEWSNPHASSVSEMVVVLLEEMGETITKDVATALLTGIIAATERFSNERTTPDTMALASKLMQLGADQQLIVAQMADALKKGPEEQPEEQVKEQTVGEIDVQPASIDIPGAVKNNDQTLTVAHEEELSPEQQLEKMISGDASSEANTSSLMEELKSAVPEAVEQPVVEQPVVEQPVVEQPVVEQPVVEQPVVEQPAMTQPVTEPQVMEPPTMEPPVMMQPVVEQPVAVEPPVVAQPVTEASKQELPTLGVPDISEFAPVTTPVEPEHNDLNVAAIPQSKVEVGSIYGTDNDRTMMQDKTMVPLDGRPKDYGALMDEALAEQTSNPAVMAAPAAPTEPEVSAVAQAPVAPVMDAMQSIPEVQPVSQPQPMMGGIELPPPPTPDVNMPMPPMPPMPAEAVAPEVPQGPALPPVQDESAAQLNVTAPTGVQVQKEPVNPVIIQPDQNPASVPPVQDPGAFKIPGM